MFGKVIVFRLFEMIPKKKKKRVRTTSSGRVGSSTAARAVTRKELVIYQNDI